MILTKNEILKEIKRKNIKIEPFDEKSVGPASVDFTLDNLIRVYPKYGQLVEISENTDYKQITKRFKIKDFYVLRPGELILGITKEKITLPGNICAWINARSRFARLGLTIHITAPFIQPGVSNKQILEIYNAGPNELKLIPGEKLCQIIFERCEGEAKYSGIFKNQEI